VPEVSPAELRHPARTGAINNVRPGRAALAAAFADGLRALETDDVSDEMLDDAHRAGERFAAARRWAQLTGDRVDTATLRRRLGISRQALHQRVAAGTVLAVPGAATTWYPTWQFHATDGAELEVRPVAAAILQHFRDQLGDQLSPLTIVGWAATQQPELEGLTPADWVANDRHDAPVLAAAARAAVALAR
jgi:hypothetical protein